MRVGVSVALHGVARRTAACRVSTGLTYFFQAVECGHSRKFLVEIFM